MFSINKWQTIQTVVIKACCHGTFSKISAPEAVFFVSDETHPLHFIIARGNWSDMVGLK